MTTEVVRVGERTPYKLVVAALRKHRVGAVPVLDHAGQVVGVVSASDLLLKEEDPAAVADGPRRLVNPTGRAERRKAGATVAGEVMSAPAVVVAETWTVAEAARLMRSERVTHLPVTDARTGRLRGIVSRGDLLGVYLRTDESIGRQVARALSAVGPLGGATPITVEVRHGVVTLRGRAGHGRGAGPAVRAVLAVEGVVEVVDQLTAP